MSMNYYLRRKRATIHESIHIAKCENGVKPQFQATGAETWPRWCDGIRYPELDRNIESLDDIMSYVDSGGWEIVDEYGALITRDEFMRDVVGWNGGTASGGAVKDAVGVPDGSGFCFDFDSFS